MDQTLKDKIAIVTGAGSGIGLATAKALHSRGALVVAADISGKETETANGLGERAAPFHADLANSDDAAGLVEFAVSQFGGVDILCNVGAVTSTKDLLADAKHDDFDRIVSVNLHGVFSTMKYAIPRMVARGGGSIVNVSSTAAIKAWRTMAAYSAAKAGVIALTRVAALEYGAQGVRANVICPGSTRTPMLLGQFPEDPSRVEYLEGLNPLHRLGMPEELAAAILFLASDASSYVTGVVLPVDGGQTM